MSLVGSLEDLDLGDILQIIHLSRKSGVLQLHSDVGAGQILFHDGLIGCAFLEGGPTDLREVLEKGQQLSASALESAAEHARARSLGLDRILLEQGLLDEDAVASVRREHVEVAVFRMFEWCAGEFSFEVREVSEEDGAGLFLAPGLNPQFLALEGTRQLDESSQADDIVFDGEEPSSGVLDLGSSEVPTPAAAESIFDDPLEPIPAADPLDAAEILLTEAVADEDSADVLLATPAVDESAADLLPAAPLADEPLEAVPASGPGTPPPPAVEPAGPPPPVVAIDRELPVLEWIKATLSDSHPQVHVFQTSELGISRIRQYLARRELPVVLIAEDAPADTLSGARDTAEIVRRLRAQASRMRVLVMAERGRADGRTGVVPKPTPTDLADERALEARRACAEALRERLAQAPEPPPAKLTKASEGRDVAALRDVSARIHDPAARGEVLTEVLEFARKSFERVALFMVRDDEAVVLAQRGLEAAGGRGEEALRGASLPLSASKSLRQVLATRAPVCHGLGLEDDHGLLELLGSAASEALLAPIESGGAVVAALYGDNLSSGRPLGDSSALEVVLHQAGLALDRAALERALEELEG